MLIGFLSPALVYALVLALHLLVPVRWTDGYVLDPATGKPLRYRLNGLRVHLIVVALYVGACRKGLIPWDFFFTHRWEAAAGACPTRAGAAAASTPRCTSTSSARSCWSST